MPSPKVTNKRERSEVPSKKATERRSEVSAAELQLVKEVRTLSKEVQNLRDFELLQVYKHPWKLTIYSLWKGMMVGFGSAIGATALVALLVYILSQFSSVPFIGNYLDNFTSKVSNQQSTK